MNTKLILTFQYILNRVIIILTDATISGILSFWLKPETTFHAFISLA